jgi:hypothetical protein
VVGRGLHHLHNDEVVVPPTVIAVAGRVLAAVLGLAAARPVVGARGDLEAPKAHLGSVSSDHSRQGGGSRFSPRKPAPTHVAPPSTDTSTRSDGGLAPNAALSIR